MSSPTTSDTVAGRFARACADLDKALRAGQKFPTEEWVSGSGPFSADEDHAGELILNEYVTRELLGKMPTPGAYYVRFPAAADRLRRLFGVDELLKDELDEPTTPTVVGVPVGLPASIGRYETREVIGTGGA